MKQEQSNYASLLISDFYTKGGILLALIEGVGIAITRMTAEQFKPGYSSGYRT